VKLYIADTNDQERSYLASVEEVEDKRARHVWKGPLDDVAAALAEQTAGDHASIEPPPGGMSWAHVRFPPAAEAEAWGYKSRGFHLTRTIDFDHLLTGELNCVLDDDVVRLEPGDFIILRAANHQWVNRGDRVATLLCLLHQPATVGPASLTRTR
jgi:hypothetical protein